jgi:phosphohistidine phosphatase
MKDMKHLLLMRHAKSSWAIAGQTDFERTLNERGLKDAPEMGKRIANQKCHPELLITSPAKRTLKTAKEVAKQIGYKEDLIEKDSLIYDAHTDEVLYLIRNLDDAFHKVMMVGHNPTFTSLVGILTDSLIENMPTAGVALISFPLESWRQIAPGTGKLEWFDFPKNGD